MAAASSAPPRSPCPFPLCPCPLQEVLLQGRISMPMSIGLVANYLLSVISLSFVGHLSTTELAAASLATTLYQMSAKILLAGM